MKAQRTNESSFKNVSRVGWSLQRLPFTFDSVILTKCSLYKTSINNEFHIDLAINNDKKL